MNRIDKKIIEVLRQYKEGLSPKRIAFYIGENHNSVKSAVRRLEREGIIRKYRGMYELVENILYGLEWYFQNLNFNYPWKIDPVGIPSSGVLEDFDELAEIYDKKKSFYGRIYFQISKEGHLSFKYGVTRVAKATCIPHIIYLAYLLFKERYGRLGNIKEAVKSTEISSIEFLRDDTTPPTKISIGEFHIIISTLLGQDKIYRKGNNRVRIERKTNCRMYVSELVEVLKYGTTYANLTKMIRKVSKNIDKINGNLREVLRIIARVQNSLMRKPFHK